MSFGMSESSLKKFLFVRTFKLLRGGGPVPPLGILYLTSSIRQHFGDRFELRIIDTGCLSKKTALDLLTQYDPDYIGICSLSCEADLLHWFVRESRQMKPEATIIIGGPHASIVGQKLLDDEYIDYLVLGEAEKTIVELLESIERGSDPSEVDGIAIRTASGPLTTGIREPIKDLDSLPLPAYDLIHLPDYSRIPTWNGALKEKFYAAMSTSRGCPYSCYFCHNIFGKNVRRRSPDNVVEEMLHLRHHYGVKEIHFIDDIFNSDMQRAKRICRLIIDSGERFSLSFPNGLRADIMDEELIRLLRKAGTYKINYGFETISPRLQKMIGKNLNIPKAVESIEQTSEAGIITGAYFMFGFPTQTREEIVETIDYAVRSNLDVAYFFKATAYPGSGFFDAVRKGDSPDIPQDFTDYHFYSVGRAHGEMETGELNRFILHAQQRFYLKPRRLWRAFIKSPNKLAFFRNLLGVFNLLIQSFIFKALAPARERQRQ